MILGLKTNDTQLKTFSSSKLLIKFFKYKKTKTLAKKINKKIYIEKIRIDVADADYMRSIVLSFRITFLFERGVKRLFMHETLKLFLLFL